MAVFVLSAAALINKSSSPEYMFVNLNVLPGNSGGPIIKVDDESVVGMVVMILGGKDNGVGLNVGLPASYIEEFINTNKQGV